MDLLTAASVPAYRVTSSDTPKSVPVHHAHFPGPRRSRLVTLGSGDTMHNQRLVERNLTAMIPVGLMLI